MKTYGKIKDPSVQNVQMDSLYVRLTLTLKLTKTIEQWAATFDSAEYTWIDIILMTLHSDR